MAYVKILRGRNLYGVEEYIFRGREEDDPVIFYNCTEGSIADQMLAIKHKHKKADMDAIHIIQSFSPEDSKKYSAEYFTEHGAELIKRMFPGHQFVVGTHTDTNQIHNHILVNPIEMKDGGRNYDKFRLLYDLREESNKISLERGLSIIEKHSRLSWERLPEEVQALKKRQGFSWVLDLKEKCDFSRSVATSFDEYAGILNQFGIEVRVENKHVQYFYPGRRQKRGDSKGLGKKYSKERLIDQFKENYEKFYNLGLKKRSIEEINFEEHWKFHRGQSEYIIPRYRIKDMVIPLKVFEKIKDVNLVNFCKENEIDLVKNEEGELFVRGKEYINIHGNGWSNEDKKTNGGAIELISYLESQSFLKTLEKFDTSGKVKKLLENTREVKPTFQAFYIKKQNQGNELEEQKKLIYKLGFSSKYLESFLKSSKLKTYKDGRVKFHPYETNKASLTFYKLAEGWNCKKSKGINQLFYSSIKESRKKTIIFPDPITFISSGRFLEKILKDKLPYNFIVPLKPIDRFLNQNEEYLRKLSHISIVKSKENVLWGDKNNNLNKEEVEKRLSGLKISYESIDELLKSLLTRSRS